MIRQHIPATRAGERHFRWRGGDVSRIEGLADAVFAISLTLLVVSLEVPATFEEMLTAFATLPVFVVCFAVLMMFWFYHYQFHRRYGLEDGWTILYNALLLFLILFYVYPLKFLFLALTRLFTDQSMTTVIDGTTTAILREGDMQTLMLLYSGGFAGIFVLFTLMTVHAWRLRESLELDPVELLQTRAMISAHLLSTAIGVVSMTLALIGTSLTVPLSGLIYAVMGPAHGLHGWWWGRKIEAAAAAR